MKFHLVTYSDGEFKKQQDFINKIHGDSFEIHAYDRDWLEGTNFYKKNYKLLDDERGLEVFSECNTHLLGWVLWLVRLVLARSSTRQAPIPSQLLGQSSFR